MFDFLFFNRDKEIKSLAEVIAVDLDKLNLSKLAIEKAISMVAKAIAKSDILIQTDSSQKRNIEYRLNVQPNDHECGTVFWTEVIKSLLTAQEALIIPMNNKYYRAASWQVTDSVLSERTYSNVMLNCAGANYGLYRTFQTSDVIHLRYDNSKIRLYLKSVVDQYDRTLDAVNAMIRLSNQPKYKLKIDGNLSLREKNADGTDRVLTKDEYTAKVKRLLESDELSILQESNGITLENLAIQTQTKAEELAKIALTINNEVANAFDIPEAVFNGNITEKSDATNEFITYACSPVAEVINDTLTAYIVGENDYSKKCERVLVWLARFKHVDVVDSAVNLDKLRGIGFSYDELREMVGYPLLNTDFSQARALTKNYAEEGQNEKTEELI
nr:MAG TPA: portal protein [Caudoviricetes sp.]